MAFNTRQTNFIAKVRTVCKNARELHEAVYDIKESFAEEFATAQDNDLSTKTTELAEWGLTYDDLAAACNQFMVQYINFWQGDAVSTREYGKDARRVASNE